MGVVEGVVQEEDLGGFQAEGAEVAAELLEGVGAEAAGNQGAEVLGAQIGFHGAARVQGEGQETDRAQVVTDGAAATVGALLDRLGLAQSQGFLVAYPLGLHGLPENPEASNPAGWTSVSQLIGPSWKAGEFCCAGAFQNSEDDQGFLRAMIAAIAREGNIDLSRVYATGLSNGGAMTQELACEASNVIAAFGPVVEWLYRALQKLVHRFESGRDLV